LTPILLKLQSKVNDFVFARKTEKDDLMKEIQTNLTRPSSSAAPSRPPPPVPQVQFRNDQQQQQAPTIHGQAPPYPTNPFQQQPYFPPMPNVYYPYSYYAQPPQQGQPPQYPGYPNYPSNQPPK
jgi:programmed cell death 6-interacting protein